MLVLQPILFAYMCNSVQKIYGCLTQPFTFCTQPVDNHMIEGSLETISIFDHFLKLPEDVVFTIYGPAAFPAYQVMVMSFFIVVIDGLPS